jgi:hypothetical protein
VAPDDVTPSETGTAAVEPVVAQLPSLREERPPRAFENRFSIVYFLLALVVSGAIAGLGVLLNQPDANSGPEWSAWKPTEQGIAGARQIGSHIAGQYRLPSGDQLTANLISPISVSGVPLTQIAVRNGTGARDVSFYGTGRSVPYTLCGLGERCSITEGTASRERQRLIRRQALELALYSFKYLKNVDLVLAYLPPPKSQQVSQALFLRKADLRAFLEHPLATTLPSRGPFVSSRRTPEAEIVDRFTAERVYAVTFQQIPDGTALIVLTPRELA